MAGYKLWVDDETVDADKVNGYLQGQTVMRFATEGERDAAFTPVVGMLTYVTGIGLQLRTSQGWQNVGAATAVTSAGRPDPTEVPIGTLIFNTTTGRPQWSNGTAWVDAVPADAVSSVAGKTGAVTIAKADVGLGNVDNTADSAKPVSTAQAAADALKVSKAGDSMTGDLAITGAAKLKTEKVMLTQSGTDRVLLYANASTVFVRNPTDTNYLDLDAGNVSVRGGLYVGGVVLGSWQTYTPTLSGTGWALGDAVVTARYCQIGKTVHVRVRIVWGSTSTFGTNSPGVSLPVTAHTSFRLTTQGGMSGGWKSGGAYYTWDSWIDTAGTGLFAYQRAAGGQASFVTATSPFVPAANDGIWFGATYEAA